MAVGRRAAAAPPPSASRGWTSSSCSTRRSASHPRQGRPLGHQRKINGIMDFHDDRRGVQGGRAAGARTRQKAEAAEKSEWTGTRACVRRCKDEKARGRRMRRRG
jgi:hypothetical protein